MSSGGYGDIGGPESSEDRKVRATEKILSSMSYRLGKLIVDSIRKPWRLILLPISMTTLLISYGKEKMGYSKFKSMGESTRIVASRECIVLFPTNGVGLGHFSRMISLARAIKRAKPSMEIVFFTTNYVLHPAYSLGFKCYHLPSRQKFDDMNPSTWNSLCEEKLFNVLSIHKPQFFVFDGAYPYRGMLNAIKNKDSVHKVWVKRLAREGADSSPIDSYSHFDRIVIPGDFIEPNEDNLKKWDIDEVNLTPPFISVSRQDLMPRGELRGRLGIPSHATVALISLGAGLINEIGDLRNYIAENIAQRGIYVVIADSMLNPTKERYDDEYIRIIKEFPIMAYRNCFDFGVISGGYNSIHESIFLKLPSLIIPNYQTGTDDQIKRAIGASSGGSMIMVQGEDLDLLELALDRISDSEVRAEMIQTMGEAGNIIDGSPYLAESLLNSVV